MRENDKYVQSISGHLAQLTNAWQQMWANAANRDVINFFIDAAKAVVNFANAVGVLPTILGLMLPYLEIITRAKSGKGIVSSFLEWANGLNEAKKATKEMTEVQEGLNVAKEAGIAINTAETASIEAETNANVQGAVASTGKTVANEAEKESTLELAGAEVIETGAEEGSTKADIEGAAASAGKTATNLAEAGSNAAAGASSFGELIGGKLSAGIGRFTGAIAGLAGTIGAVPLAIGAATVVLFAAKKAYDAHRESVFADAKATAENIKTQQEATSQQIESYKQLKTQLDSGDLSEQETINVKQQILDIQKSITEQYGTAAQGVDLINGKLEEQVGLLDSISQKEAQDQYFKDYEGFQVAEEEYNKNNRRFTFGLSSTGNSDLNQAITNVLFKNGLIDNNTGTLGLDNMFATAKGTASDSIKTLEDAKKALEELKAEYRDRDSLEALNSQIAKIEEQIGSAYEVVDKYEATTLKGLELGLAVNDTKGYDIYKNYQSSVSNLEDAYITGDTQKINEARKAFDEATKAKNDFLKVGDNGQFALLFDKIDTSLINTKNRFRDTVELLKDIPEPEEKEGLFGKDSEKIYKKNAKAESKVTKETKKAYKAAKELYNLNPDKVDIRATLEDNSYASRQYADALNTLMKEMGWTTADADSLIDALVAAGIVHGDAADIAYMASDSYNAFSSSVESTIGVLNTLNTALTESAKGTGLTEQTLTELRAAFGDNLDSVLERTANGYHLNTQGAYLLRQEQEAMVNADYASSMYEQYQALDKLQEGYLKAKAAGEDTSGFVQQRQAIQNNIDKLNESLMAFNNANSAYQTWLSKQNSEGEREMYNSVYSGYDAVKDELERGWAGEKTRSWLDLIFNDENEDWDAWTSSAEKIKEKFDEITKDIKGTGGYSIADFFTVDANGKTTSQGVWNFFDAIQNKQKEVGKEFVNLEEGWFDFTENGDYQIAEMLGMDIESVHSILRAAADAGFEIHLDQPLFSLEQLKEKAISAKEALEETTGTELKINLDPQSEGEVDDAMQKLMGYQQSLAEDTSIDPKVKTERLQQVADLLNFMAAKKREFVEGKLFDFKILDSKELETSKKNINDIVNKLSSYSKEAGKTEFSKQFAIDPMLLNNVDYLQEKIDTLKEIRPNVDDTQVQYLDQLLAQLQYRVNLLNETDISGGSITVDQFMAAEQVVNDINAKLDYAAQHQDIHFDWDADETFIENLNLLANLPEEVKTELGIAPDATGEELLELAKSGELHLEVKTSGDTPKPKNTQTTNTQTNNTINKTTTITEEQVNQVVTASMDTSSFDKGAKHVQEEDKKIDKENPKPEVGMDSKEFKKGSNDVNKQTKELNNLKATPSVALAGKNQVINDAQAMKSAIDSVKSKTVSVVANFSHSGLGAVKEAINSVVSKVSEAAAKLRGGLANGTAHAYGTAFARGSVVSNHAYASGKWGLPDDQTALTGELGTEIVVRDGNWFTVGDDGAEFVNLKKGDIVFNHKQSRELLENGYVTSNKGRGHLVGFANGTAYSHGSTSGALRPSKKSTGMGGSTRSSGGGSRGSGGSGGSGGGNSSSKDAKETKNTLDEVEILIGRIEARISDLDKIIGSTYNTWEDRNDSILDNLKLVTQEISDQRKAYTTYMNKANSINLSESWKQKIRDGAFRIEDVTDSDLWDKIQEYQNYYNKAVQSEQALIDLTNKRGELYKQLFDNTQTYYDNMVEAIQHEIDIQDTFIDRLEEAGRLSSKILIYRQFDQEQQKLVKLNEELQTLKQREKDALNSGYIEYGSETWSEMESAIADVCAAIEEAENNLISYDKALNEVDWSRWDRIHDSIDGVVNELEFIYDLINEDDLFTEQGDITDQGTTALALLAHEYDVYFAEVQEYQKEIDQVQEDLAKDPYNQILVDKLKELKEAQQDAASGAKKMKESIVDVIEKGIKKQIDYVKKLIEDYEELLETQKDQIDYAKRVADQQKELNRLEKQYRAIQNDDSEETATRRQQLKNQIEEARENLKETQDDRRLSETKDMLSKFEESFEEFLENKLKDIEGVVREAIDTANASRGVIKDTINDLASSYGYTPSDTLKSTLDDMSRSFVSYFNRQFENDNVASIADNVSKIVEYYQRVQNQTNQEAAQDTMTEAVRHDGNIQTYRDENGNTVSGYFRSDGTRDETYTGWAGKQGRKYRFENGELLTGSQFIDVNGKRYHLDNNGAVQTGWQKINDQWYYMNNQGEMQTGWQNLNGKWYYLNSKGQMLTGAQQIDGKTYVMDESGAMLSRGWNKSNGKWYYLNNNGSAKTGWFKDNNKWYYLNSKGEMQTGAQKVDGKQYVFDESGAMLAGGWKKLNGKWYHLGAGGIADTGWFKDNGKWYYLDKQGAMQTGLQKIGNKTYIMDASGAMLSNGWQKANNQWYYLDSSGAAKTGWQKINGKWYLLDNQGAMKTGFYSESGKTYYLNGSGAMSTGWQKINGNWYYFNDNGAAASGWASVNGEWYYFDPDTKVMAANSWIDGSGITTNPQKGAYYVGANGAMVKDGRRNTNRGWLTFEKNGKWTGYKTGTSGVGTSGLYWTNEGNKAEAIIRKSDGAILTPLSKGDSVIPNSAMKNMYQALTDPAKYLKQYTTPDVRVIQNSNSSSNQPPIVNMQFIANGVQDANKFVNDLMNNKKLEKWVQEVTLGQANGNNNYKKYSYIVR